MSTNDSTLGGEAPLNRDLQYYLNEVTQSLPPGNAALTPVVTVIAGGVWQVARQAENDLGEDLQLIGAGLKDLKQNQQLMGADLKDLMTKVDALTEQLTKVDALTEQWTKVDALTEQLAVFIQLQRAQRET